MAKKVKVFSQQTIPLDAIYRTDLTVLDNIVKTSALVISCPKCESILRSSVISPFEKPKLSAKDKKQKISLYDIESRTVKKGFKFSECKCKKQVKQK
jgi:hypothetical protein